MSTIPSTFEENVLRRTVITGGGFESAEDCSAESAGSSPGVSGSPFSAEGAGGNSVTAVLLTGGTNQYRDQQVDCLCKNGFAAVVSVETCGTNYHLEDLARRYPQVKFLVLPETATPGDCVNAAAAESRTDYLLVLRDTLKITPQLLGSRGAFSADVPVVTVPKLSSRTGLPLPVTFSPSLEKKRFTVDMSLSATEGEKTLYPFDYIGLYHRSKFMGLGGFDRTIIAPYWQLLDFSLRAWLWGERIVLAPRIAFSYDAPEPENDLTVNASYLRFYLKTIAPVRKGGRAYIPGLSFFSFARRSRADIFDVRRLFLDARAYLNAVGPRFAADIHELCAGW